MPLTAPQVDTIGTSKSERDLARQQQGAEPELQHAEHDPAERPALPCSYSVTMAVPSGRSNLVTPNAPERLVTGRRECLAATGPHAACPRWVPAVTPPGRPSVPSRFLLAPTMTPIRVSWHHPERVI
jgi:hypothetical protein